MLRFIHTIIILIASSLFIGQVFSDYNQKDLNNELVIAAKWMQHSPEYRALVYQGFNFATDRLTEKLSQLPKDKKPAIIVDIDDTLINGSPFFSSLIDTSESFTIERIRSWWNYGADHQEALPGALEFIKYAETNKIEIFYISGRYKDVMPQTIKALKRCGFPFADQDHILLQTPATKMLSKAKRRELVKEKGFDILLYMGDQLDDLTEPPSLVDYEQQAWVDQHASCFGRDWIIFPNPLHGNWESTIAPKYTTLTPEEKHKIRTEKLRISLKGTQDPLFHQHIIQAAIWQNFSGSYRALNYQAYNQAGWQLKKIARGIKDALPAVVVDIDGTVFNISDQLSLLNMNRSPEAVDKVLLRTDSPLINGAKPFLIEAKTLGYEIFYVTNRSTSSKSKPKSGDIKQATLISLKNYSLPNADSDHLLCREESFCLDSRKTCNKESRRQAIERGDINGKKYQIVMLIGDSLNDFDLTEQKLDPTVSETADKMQSMFGRKYILIPNLLNMPEIAEWSITMTLI